MTTQFFETSARKLKTGLTSTACMAAICLGAGPAMSDVVVEQVYPTITGPELQSLMQDWGYRAELGVDDVDDPKITTKSNGVTFSIFFYECDDQTPKQCGSLGFSSWLDLPEPLSMTQVNEWNLNKRFGTASIDDEGDPKLELNINVDGGITAQGLRENFDWWERAFGEFLQHVDW
jgi:hypothetical protein